MKRYVTVTIAVEHIDGPIVEEDWEQDAHYVIEQALLRTAPTGRASWCAPETA